jgi:hypothetical protein
MSETDPIISPLARKLPMELVNKILLLRPSHPITEIIKHNFIIIEWYNMRSGEKESGEPLWCKNKKVFNQYEKHINDLNKAYFPLLKHHVRYLGK